MSRVGEKIKNIRMNSGMTQKQLAKKVGVSETFINEVENGRKIINQNLIDKISKVLGKEINDITMAFEEQTFHEENKFSREPKKEEVRDIWNEALGAVLKNVPVYKYNLKDVVGVRQLPLINNKIDGHSQDKVLFLEIEEDDMAAFRISKGDIAFAHITHEVENNSICLIQYNEERVVRQIKKLDNNKVLLVCNKGNIRTETVELKNFEVLAKLDKVEIRL